MSTYFCVKAHPSCRISPAAGILGTVNIGENVSIWGGAQVRADEETITIGANSNIQECAVLHIDRGFPLEIGEGVTIGHGAIVHGCTIESGCTIGMGAVVLNGAHIGAGSMVAAGAVVPQGKVFGERSLIVGVPGKLVRTLSEAEAKEMCSAAADSYVQMSAEMVAEGAMFNPDADWHGQTGGAR